MSVLRTLLCGCLLVTSFMHLKVHKIGLVLNRHALDLSSLNVQAHLMTKYELRN
jgi:hypothetical protein